MAKVMYRFLLTSRKMYQEAKARKFDRYLGLINRARSLYGSLLTEAMSTNRTQRGL